MQATSPTVLPQGCSARQQHVLESETEMQAR